jgi:hypothetical protein
MQSIQKAPALWRLGNRLRALVGLPARPKKCCRNPDNLGPHEPASPDGQLTVQRCRVCGCRHFESRVDPGQLGISAD